MIRVAAAGDLHFGQDSAGELYLVDYGNGAVLRLRAGP